LSLTDGVSEFNGLECLIVKENTLDSRSKGEKRIRIFPIAIIFWLYAPLLWVRQRRAFLFRKYSKLLSLTKRLRTTII